MTSLVLFLRLLLSTGRIHRHLLSQEVACIRMEMALGGLILVPEQTSLALMVACSESKLRDAERQRLLLPLTMRLARQHKLEQLHLFLPGQMLGLALHAFHNLALEVHVLVLVVVLQTHICGTVRITQTVEERLLGMQHRG